MNTWAMTILLLMARYLHIVAATMLVGGTLFYEMVVPIAIDELSDEQKLLVFARARWMFRGIVWLAAVLIIASGAINTKDHWKQYLNEKPQLVPNSPRSISQDEPPMPVLVMPGMWWAAHASTGLVSVIIALALTIGPVPPSKPLRWMRLNLVILLLVIFLATVTRHARLQATIRQSPVPIPQGAG